MIFENEILRMRTININAEVEKGHMDIKKLRKENDSLRHEIWSLREAYDRLEKLLRSNYSKICQKQFEFSLSSKSSNFTNYDSSTDDEDKKPKSSKESSINNLTIEIKDQNVIKADEVYSNRGSLSSIEEINYPPKMDLFDISKYEANPTVKQISDEPVTEINPLKDFQKDRKRSKISIATSMFDELLNNKDNNDLLLVNNSTETRHIDSLDTDQKIPWCSCWGNGCF